MRKFFLDDVYIGVKEKLGELILILMELKQKGILLVFMNMLESFMIKSLLEI